MRRSLSLRQIEAFKAVMEHGTISSAAEVLHVSPPAVSKMIASLEADADLALFDRPKGRLAPTPRGTRLYEEIDRIFSGVQQVENAVDAIRREGQGRITIGVMPALAGPFVQQVTTGLLKRHPSVFCVVENRSSQRIVEWLLTGELDVGLVTSTVGNPYLVSEPLLEAPLVCIMPPGHALAAKRVVRAADLDGLPFVAFKPDGVTGQRVAAILGEREVSPRIMLVASIASTLCEFVAAGHGVSLVHPLMARSLGKRLIARRFEPAIPLNFQVVRSRDSRSAGLVRDFVEVAHETARQVIKVAAVT